MFRHYGRMLEEVAEAERSGGVVWSELARRFVEDGRASPGLRGPNLRAAWEVVKARKARTGRRAARMEARGLGGAAVVAVAGDAAGSGGEGGGAGEHAAALLRGRKRMFPGTGGEA